jgi:RNA polymerase sigma-70 factor (ECF subfamily)
MRHVDGLSDEQLVRRLMAGDSQALAALVSRHHRPLLGYLYRLTRGDHPLAEDLVQETFVRLLRQDSYQPDRAFKPWLYAIATNLARDAYRAAARGRAVCLGDAPLPDLPDAGPGPEERALVADQARAVRDALDQLGEEYRQTLLLRFYQGLRLDEIAVALDIPLGTVKSRLSVGTRRLRELLTTGKEGAVR